MIQEPQSKNWIVVIVAIISAAGLICAAIIGLGVPFAERYADSYFPPTQSPSNPIAPTESVLNQAPANTPINNDPTGNQPLPTFPPQNLTILLDGPFREHQTASVGTGVFTQVTSSDGNASYSQTELDTNHFQIYRIRPEENPDGCGVSIYNTDKVWFSSSANTVFTVNGQEVGKLSVSTGRHGFIADWSVNIGDKICAVGYASSGFHIVFGPDLYYHYDSYCFRGNC